MCNLERDNHSAVQKLHNSTTVITMEVREELLSSFVQKYKKIIIVFDRLKP